jgi:hypothetical protein
MGRRFLDLEDRSSFERGRGLKEIRFKGGEKLVISKREINYLR